MNSDNKRLAQEIHYKGYLYYTGTKGYEQSYEKAYKCFFEAAELGYDESLNGLGLMYMDGTYVEKNYSKAVYYLNRAMQTNPTFARAAYNLGRIYITGSSDVMVNLELARNYFYIATKYGKEEHFYAYACHFMGYVLIELGRREEAVSYVLDAVNTNEKIAEAWFNLGLLTDYRVFHPKSGKLCWWYYEKSAKLGYNRAMYVTARHYYELYQFEEDFDWAYKYLEQANMWKQRAIDAGYDLAKRLHKPHRVTGPAYENHHTMPKDSGTHNIYLDSNSNCSFSGQQEEQGRDRHFVFYDAKGNYTESGHCFYDFKGNYVEWGAPFYDARGNYCEWGAPFYDSRGNYITWGSPFYDSKGNYIVP